MLEYYQAGNYQIKLLSYWNISELSIELGLARDNSDTILIYHAVD